MRKKTLLILVVCILAVSIPATIALINQGQQPSDGGTADVPTDEPTDTPTTHSTLTILSMTEGNILVMKAGTDSWIEAQVGMSLEVGDTIKSGDSSSAEITFFDGSTIELEAGTEIEVVSLGISGTGSTTIKLKQAIGNTISRVTKLVDSASSYEVETSACVAAVRGSSMLVQVIADGTTWVTNLEGEIWVTANGVELQIPEGRKCIIISGQPPQLVPSGGGGGGGGFSPNLDIAITKTAKPAQVHEGDAVNYTYNVTNPGDVPLSSVSVTDDMIEVVLYQSGDTDSDGRLDTNETWIFTATHNVTAGDDSPLRNTASASGVYLSQRIIDWTTASVDILRPNIALTKTADREQAHDGDTITYNYTITNTGNTPLSDVLVTDDTIEGVTYKSGDTNEDKILGTDETWVFAANYTVNANDPSILVNKATATGADALGRKVTAQATASVTIEVDIPTYGIKIELSWNTTGTDLDAHLIRPSGQYGDEIDDCHWQNMNPDWGVSGVTEDNPLLDKDDRDGDGPEYITLKQPEEGTYQYKVHYYTDRGHGPSLATVIVWINDDPVAKYSKVMSNNEVWDCCYIDWPSGKVTPTQE
jgi:uncharacterized repeat protein (TIGR01451 family)